jgi:hypothetical protein
MPQTAPKDVIEKYAAGNAVVATYQTSGVSSEKGQVLPSQGQADSYAVITSNTPIDEAAMSRIMDGLSDRGNAVANGDFEKGSTGALVSVNQVSPREPGAASFDIVAGARGDSRTFIATVDAGNAVTLYDVNANLKPAENPTGIIGFGAEGERGSNEMLTHRVNVKGSEAVFVLNVSDGVTDGYFMTARTEGRSGNAYLEDFRADIEAHLKANPQAQDFSRFLSERATVLGAQDNTTVTSIRLDAATNLQGKSVTMGVFDGIGHEDGTLSSALARQLEKEVPGAEPQSRVLREEIDHVSTRAEDLARARNPAAAHPAEKPAADPAREAAPPKDGPGGGDSHGGGSPATSQREARHPPSDEHAPKKSASPQEQVATRKPPGHEHVVPHKPAAPHEHAAAAKTHVEPIHEKPRTAVHAGGLRGKISGHAGTGTGVASLALQLAEGDFKGAGLNAGFQLALSPGTYKAAAALTESIAPVAKALGFLGKKVPVVGAVVTVGFVAYEVGKHAAHGEYGKAGAALGAGAAETVGNLVGFGVGDLAREGVRAGVILAAGEKYAPEKSGLRQLGEGAVHIAHQAIDGAAHHQAAAKPAAPSIYHYKNLPAVGYALKDTPDQALHGKTVRTPDGFIKNLREINFADPKNLKAFEDAIHRRIRKNEQLIEAGKPLLDIKVVSSFLGLRTNTRKIDDAKVEVRQLHGALRELEMFKRDVHAHHGHGPQLPAQSQFHSGHAQTAAGGGHAAPSKPAAKPVQHPKAPTPH